MYWHDAAWWAWIPMSLAMLAIWGLIAWIVIRVLVAPSAGDRPSPPSARATLDARLARGEISREEYLELRRLIESEHGHMVV